MSAKLAIIWGNGKNLQNKPVRNGFSPSLTERDRISSGPLQSSFQRASRFLAAPSRQPLWVVLPPPHPRHWDHILLTSLLCLSRPCIQGWFHPGIWNSRRNPPFVQKYLSFLFLSPLDLPWWKQGGAGRHTALTFSGPWISTLPSSIAWSRFPRLMKPQYSHLENFL